MGRLEGRVCLVTGAGRGIGASVARGLAREGAHVVVNDYGVAVDGTAPAHTAAAGVVDEIRKAGGRAVANHGNVASYDDAEAMVKQALTEFGRLDVLVNVAGILRDRMIFNLSAGDWKAVLDVHLKGTFNTTHFASIYWRQAREGNYRLINFTSESGLYGAPGQPNYAAAKAGIVGLTYSCANALGRYGVTANCISPRAATRMTQTIPDGRSAPAEANPETSPDNIVPPVAWLAAEQSGWFTGQVVGVHDYEITLFNNPAIISRLVSDGKWDLKTAISLMDDRFRNAIAGMDPGTLGALGRG